MSDAIAVSHVLSADVRSEETFPQRSDEEGDILETMMTKEGKLLIRYWARFNFGLLQLQWASIPFGGHLFRSYIPHRPAVRLEATSRQPTEGATARWTWYCWPHWSAP